jgi:hypothetical protein
MKVSPALATLALALCGCASAPAGSDALGHGDANYDALKAATQACQAQGGQLQLKSGYDDRDLASYECKSGKAR